MSSIFWEFAVFRKLTPALGIALGAAATLSLAATRPAATANAVTCQSPVGRDDGASTLLRRLRGKAVIEDVAGPEGDTLRAVVLNPRDHIRRLEVIYLDRAMRHPSYMRTRSSQSAWTFGGLRVGDSLDRVNRVNGRPFDLWGFQWDYAGDVQNWGGGTLASMPGGCTLSARFDVPGAEENIIPGEISGERTLRSDLAILRHARPFVAELSIFWPEPQASHHERKQA